MMKKTVTVTLAIILVLLVSIVYIMDYSNPKKTSLQQKKTVLIKKNESPSEYIEFSTKMKEEIQIQKDALAKAEALAKQQAEEQAHAEALAKQQAEEQAKNQTTASTKKTTTSSSKQNNTTDWLQEGMEFTMQPPDGWVIASDKRSSLNETTIYLTEEEARENEKGGQYIVTVYKVNGVWSYEGEVTLIR